MDLKNRLCDIQTNRRDRLHGPAPANQVISLPRRPRSVALTCRWGAVHSIRSRHPAPLRANAEGAAGEVSSALILLDQAGELAVRAAWPRPKTCSTPPA